MDYRIPHSDATATKVGPHQMKFQGEWHRSHSGPNISKEPLAIGSGEEDPAGAWRSCSQCPGEDQNQHFTKTHRQALLGPWSWKLSLSLARPGSSLRLARFHILTNTHTWICVPTPQYIHVHSWPSHLRTIFTFLDLHIHGLFILALHLYPWSFAVHQTLCTVQNIIHCLWGFLGITDCKK